jgi:hypothetical protein
MKPGLKLRPFLRAAFVVSAALGAAAVATYACVPADTRPPPASLTLTVSPSEAAMNGVVTADGWKVTFDRVILALGNEGLGDSCTVYGEADYDRIIDLSAGPRQKLGILHALGKCDLRFRMSPPSFDAVLGSGVTEEDKIRMSVPLVDPYLAQGGGGGGGGDQATRGAGTAIAILGTAWRNGIRKQFYLIYRRRVRFQRCTPDAPPPDASFATLASTAAFSDAGASVDLPEPADVVFDLRVEPEAILRDDLNPTAASLRFDPFAAADVDGDGLITLDELRQIPISQVRKDAGAFEAGTYVVDDAGALQRGRPVVIESLGDYVYELLVPTLIRFRGDGWCVASTGRRPG